MGCGRWGTFIAWYLDRQNHKVKLYGIESSKTYAQLKNERSNGTIPLTENMELTNNLKETVELSEAIVISVGAQNLRGFMEEIKPYGLKNKTIILCMKGIEDNSGKRLSEVVLEFIDPKETSLAVWVGPGHPQDFINGIPNCMVIDSYDIEVKEKLIKEFSSDLIRFYYGNDMIGNELGAAIKNVIGIAAGMLDGMGKTALKGALMTRGAHEVALLIEAMGGNPMSAYGLSHLGDYQATVFSEYSHNRMFGEQFVKKQKYEKLAEGVATTKALKLLSEKYNVAMPICEGIYQALFENKDPEKTLQDMFMRTIKNEF